MIGKERAIELTEKLLWMTQEYVQLAGMPKSYGTDERFYSLDIHLIHSIGTEPGSNVTALARKHGISKSAVSQALKKLERRELVRRFKARENRKEVLFDLTERGREAFDAHLRFHKRAEEPFLQEMARFSREEEKAMEKTIDLLLRRAAHVRSLIEDREGQDDVD